MQKEIRRKVLVLFIIFFFVETILIISVGLGEVFYEKKWKNILIMMQIFLIFIPKIQTRGEI